MCVLYVHFMLRPPLLCPVLAFPGPQRVWCCLEIHSRVSASMDNI